MILRVDGAPHGVHAHKRTVPGITLMELRYGAHTRLSRHTHARASICMVLAGGFVERVGKQTLEVGQHDAVYKLPEVEHADSCGGSGARLLVAEFDPAWIEVHEFSRTLVDNCALLAGAAAADFTQRLFRELTCSDIATPLAIQSICLDFLVHVSRTAVVEELRRVPGWLRQAREILHDGYAQQLSLDAIAGRVGVHPVHLAQVFRKCFGLTIGDYTRRLRVHEASHQLLSTERTIADIALSCGFCDQSHMSRVFKRINATTPAEFRRSSGRSTSCVSANHPRPQANAEC